MGIVERNGGVETHDAKLARCVREEYTRQAAHMQQKKKKKRDGSVFFCVPSIHFAATCTRVFGYDTEDIMLRILYITGGNNSLGSSLDCLLY